MAAREHRTEQIDAYDLRPMVERLVRTKCGGRVVDEYVHVPVTALGKRHEVADLTVVADVGAIKRRASAFAHDRLGGLLSAGFVDVGDDDRRAVPREAQRNGAPASRAASAGDDDRHRCSRPEGLRYEDEPRVTAARTRRC